METENKGILDTIQHFIGWILIVIGVSLCLICLILVIFTDLTIASLGGAVPAGYFLSKWGSQMAEFDIDDLFY